MAFNLWIVDPLELRDRSSVWALAGRKTPQAATSFRDYTFTRIAPPPADYPARPPHGMARILSPMTLGQQV